VQRPPGRQEALAIFPDGAVRSASQVTRPRPSSDEVDDDEDEVDDAETAEPVAFSAPKAARGCVREPEGVLFSGALQAKQSHVSRAPDYAFWCVCTNALVLCAERTESCSSGESARRS
jgi:hypothetical protein